MIQLKKSLDLLIRMTYTSLNLNIDVLQNLLNVLHSFQSEIKKVDQIEEKQKISFT